MVYEIRTYGLAAGSLAEVEKRFGEAYEHRKWKPFPIRGGLIPGYELLLRGWSLLGPLGGSFFFVSCPATHLHHPMKPIPESPASKH